WRSLTQHSISHQLLCAVDCPVLIARARRKEASRTVAKVVMAIAGGDDVEPAARAAAAAGLPDASVTVVHVRQALFGAQGFAYVESNDEMRQTMARACQMLIDSGVTVQGMVAHQGPVAEAVAQIAKDLNADLIVIGSESDLLLKERRSELESGPSLLHPRRRQERAKALGVVASDVMTTPPITVRCEATLPQAARLMQGRNVRRLVVVDARGKIAG